MKTNNESRKDHIKELCYIIKDQRKRMDDEQFNKYNQEEKKTERNSNNRPEDEADRPNLDK